MAFLIILIYLIIGSLCSALVYAYNCKEYKKKQGIKGSRVERNNMSWKEYSKENEVTEFCTATLFFWICVIPICAIVLAISYVQREIKNYYNIN